MAFEAGDVGGRSSRAVDFLDAGLSLYERQCVSPGGGVRFHQARADLGAGRGGADLGADPHPRAQDALSAVRRLQLDQLWLWHCLNYTYVTYVPPMGELDSQTISSN